MVMDWRDARGAKGEGQPLSMMEVVWLNGVILDLLPMSDETIRQYAAHGDQSLI